MIIQSAENLYEPTSDFLQRSAGSLKMFFSVGIHCDWGIDEGNSFTCFVWVPETNPRECLAILSIEPCILELP